MADDVDLGGTVLAGRYRVLSLLGGGGMGSVWLVQHSQSLQHYALKTLHPRAARDRMTVERFLREARAAAALQSKHVVKVVDADMDHVDARTKDPQPFLVMELLRGCNLEQYISSYGKLEPAELAWVFQQIARALDLAHGLGIVHRDLKPENLFVAVDEDDVPLMKVCDFGIAKLGGQAASGLLSTNALGTDVNITMGTPLYMSPEQARSSTKVVPASDQWAIGLIAFKCLTGEDYFAAADNASDLLLMIINDPIVPPSSRFEGLPSRFDEWFLRSCQRDPSARWASVVEQVDAFIRTLELTPKSLRKPDAVDSLALAKTEQANAAQLSATEAATTASVLQTTTNYGGARPQARARSKTMLIAVPIVAIAAAGLAAVSFHRRETAPPPAAATGPAVSTTEQPSPKSVPVPRPTEVSSAPPPPTEVSSAPAASSSLPAKATMAPKWKVAAPKASASAPIPVSAPTTTAAPKLPKGAACEKSADCESHVCVAYTCE